MWRISRIVENPSPKVVYLLGICREEEETRSLLCGMGTVGLPGVDGHNGSIEGHVA